MPSRQTELTLKRKALIQEAIKEHGFTKKYDVIQHFKGHPLFNFSDRNFRDLITFDYDDIVDPTHTITGKSTLKDAEGNVVMEWVKTSKDKDKVLEAAKAAVEELCQKVVKIPKIKKPTKRLNKNLLNQYTITDYHLGMMALECEVGEDWTIEKAEQVILDWFAEGIAQSPDAEECIFAQIGDFLHFDSIEAVTPTSKHLLDTNTRFTNLVRVAIRVIDKIIQMLLQKYKVVNVILAEGNHDISSSIWLRESFSYRFADNKRVKVDNTAIPYYCFEFGECVLFYHHAHKRRMKDLDSTLVAFYKEQFGKAKHVYGHTGHLHHEKIIESNLMIIEQHPTLSTPDAHAVREGYSSKRSSKVITYHKNFGEVGRISISPEMLKG